MDMRAAGAARKVDRPAPHGAGGPEEEREERRDEKRKGTRRGDNVGHAACDVGYDAVRPFSAHLLVRARRLRAAWISVC
jgi:hypothetical protein